MPKAVHASQARLLTDIPNIDKSIAQDLRGLGVNTHADVAAKGFINGGPALPWWHFTVQRKAKNFLLNKKDRE